MVKKLKTLAKEEETQLASAVRTSAQQIWQAGLGAFAKAQEEGGRVFSKLVKEGTELQKRAEDRVFDVSGTVGKMADGVGKQASGSWDKLEQVFEDRVSRALGKIGVPTQQDIQELSKRIEELNKALAALSGKKAPAVKAAAKASLKVAAKPAAKAATKPAAKPVAKPVAKAATPAAKPVAKTAAKPAAKPTAKAAPKAAAKPTTKAAAKKGAAQATSDVDTSTVTPSA